MSRRSGDEAMRGTRTGKKGEAIVEASVWGVKSARKITQIEALQFFLHTNAATSWDSRTARAERSPVSRDCADASSETPSRGRISQ